MDHNEIRGYICLSVGHWASQLFHRSVVRWSIIYTYCCYAEIDKPASKSFFIHLFYKCLICLLLDVFHLDQKARNRDIDLSPPKWLNEEFWKKMKKISFRSCWNLSYRLRCLWTMVKDCVITCLSIIMMKSSWCTVINYVSALIINDRYAIILTKSELSQFLFSFMTQLERVSH